MNKNVGYLKYCEVCRKPYMPTSNRQRYCVECGPAAKHQNQIDRCRRYHAEHYEYKGIISKVRTTIDIRRVKAQVAFTANMFNTGKTVANDVLELYLRYLA